MSIPVRYQYLRNKETMRKYLWSHYCYFEKGEQKMTAKGVEIAGELGIILECPFLQKTTIKNGKRR